MNPARAWIAAGAAAVALAFTGSPATAQSAAGSSGGDQTTDSAAPAEPFTPAGHWSRDALRRLSGLGLIDVGEVSTAWPIRRSRVRALLEEARLAAEERDRAHAALAAGYLRRFEAEFPAPEPDAWFRAGGRVDGGWAGRSGVLIGGMSDWDDDVDGWVYGGPVAMPDQSEPVAAPTLDLGLGSVLAISGRVRHGSGRTRAEEVYAVARWARVDLWAGRRPLALGPAQPAGVVLSDAVPFHGVGAALPDGVALPGVLRGLGRLRGTFMLARLERSGNVRRPYFWAMRLAVSPSSSLTIGGNRAAIFGGDGNDGITLRNLAYMLIGLTDTRHKTTEFENQVASADVVWVTTVSGMPLTVYGEWGLEDMGGAWRRVPGILAGVEVAAVPGLEAVSLGLERVAFSRSGGGNPPWYRHGGLGDGWTDRGRLLGHPLGGHGTQWSLRTRIEPPRSSASTALQLYYRHRRVENLFAPDRTGSSTGAALEFRVHRNDRIRFDAGLDWEEGRRGWRRWNGRAGLGVSF